MQVLPTFNRAIRRYLRLRGVACQRAEVDGHDVHYYELRGTGRGPPVVFVHGLGGAANGFYRMFKPLARHFGRVFALDLPGSGFSPNPQGGALGGRAQVGVLSRFVECVVGEPLFLVGNSLGAAMCIQLTHDRPEQVKGLALISPAGARVADDRMKALFDALNVDTVARAHAIALRLFHKPPFGLRLWAPDLQRMYSTDSVKAVIREQRTSGFVAPEVLGNLRVPTLLLWGEKEKLLPFEGIYYFREHLPADAEIYVVPGFAHLPQIERPREVIRRLIAFATRAGILGAPDSHTIR
jgi:pimeloyl-ACP methyl ester carboxylesterase